MKTVLICLTVCFTLLLQFTDIKPIEAIAYDANTAAVIDKACDWAVAICNDNSHGYGTQGNINGPDYACTTLIAAAYTYAGIPFTKDYTCGDWDSKLPACGFERVDFNPSSSAELQRGDIVWNGEHVELYIGDNQLASANSNRGYPQTGDQTGTEVHVHKYYSGVSGINWKCAFRLNRGYGGYDDELGIPYPRPQVSSTVWLGKNGITSGNYVKWLQTALNKADNAGLAVDGQFGSGTTTAVKNFQAKHGLTQDGQAGTSTINKLVEVIKNKLNPPAPSIKAGIKIWMSDSKMGNEVSSFKVGEWCYLCYKIYDEYSGKLISEVTTLKDYKITETIYNPDGSVANTCAYDNSDNNWIGIRRNVTGTYKWEIKLTINGKTASGNGEFNIICTHSYGSWTTTKSATCTLDGSEKRTCSVCGKSETRTLSATGHSYNSKVISPTNSEKGYTLHTCSKCGSNYKDNFTDELVLEFLASESFVNINIDANERKSITFSYKNVPLSVERVSIQAENGDDHVVDFEWGEWKNHTISLYFEGYRTGTENVTVKLFDSDTKEILATKTIKVTVSECNHSFNKWSTTKEPTCADEGIESRECTICGKVETRYIFPIEHDWSEWKVVKEATCTTQGERSRTCNICKVHEGHSIPEISHQYTENIVKPTRTENGYTLHTCSFCGNSYKDNFIEKINIKGDINNDGKFDIDDLEMLQKWLLSEPDVELADWKAADLCEDDRLDAFDMIEMRKLLIENK